MSSAANSAVDSISSGLASLGKYTAIAGAAVTAMGVQSLKSFGTFEASLNKAAVVAGGTSKNIGELADVANKMGAELPLSAQDAADAMVQMAQDGANLDTIKEEFPAIAKAATAAGADLQATAGTVQVAMNIWETVLDHLLKRLLSLLKQQTSPMLQSKRCSKRLLMLDQLQAK